MPTAPRHKSRAAALLACCAIALAACGDDDGGASPDRADLDRPGTTWAALDGDDKLVLVSLAKDRFTQVDPTLVGDIRAYTGALLRNRMDRFYARPANRKVTIYRAYRTVDAALAAEQDRLTRDAVRAR